MNTVIPINGFNFYFETLDFQGDSKKFYITYHNDISFRSFDIVINQKWINEVGFEKVMECLSKVFNDPLKSTKKTLGDWCRVKAKIDYYKRKQSKKEKQLEKQLFEEIIKYEFKKIENVELTLIRKFRLLNEFGKASAMDYINDLIEMNRYKLEV